MGRVCQKCQDKLPYFAKIDGKRRSLSKRKYCLKCSPFGQHNTSQLERAKAKPFAKKKNCIHCLKEFLSKKGRVCATCNHNVKKKRRQEKLYGIVGTACWKCGYNKGLEGVGILDFHHVDPSTKENDMSTRTVAMLSWEKVITEARKCCLLCCRCHREFHCGFLEKEEILTIWKSRWSRISEVAQLAEQFPHKEKVPGSSPGLAT